MYSMHRSSFVNPLLEQEEQRGAGPLFWVEGFLWTECQEETLYLLFLLLASPSKKLVNKKRTDGTMLGNQSWDKHSDGDCRKEFSPPRLEGPVISEKYRVMHAGESQRNEDDGNPKTLQNRSGLLSTRFSSLTHNAWDVLPTTQRILNLGKFTGEGDFEFKKQQGG